jgi:ribosomal protein L40E
VPEIGGLSIPMHSTASAPSPAATCRFCRGTLHSVVDLGMSPLCEICVPADSVAAMEALYPLHANVCESCHLVQLEKFG